MSTQAMNAYEQLISMLDERKVAYRLIDHAPEGRTDVVSQLRGNALSQAAKCIVVMVKLGKKDKRYCLAVIPGDARLDLKAVQALFSGDYATFAPQEIAEALTGSIAGTILPFSFREDLPAVVDPSLVANDEIVFNAARLDQSMWIKSSDYIAAANPRIAPIVQSANASAGADNPKSKIENPKSEEMISYGKGKQMPLALYKKRHSLAHIMAEAVLDSFPEAKPTIGPPVENGFYYDFAVPKPFTPEDLDKIEARMREIVQKHVDFSRREVSDGEARDLFKDNPFKLELIDGLTKGADEYGESGDAISNLPSPISIYKHDTFTDLCRGPHVANTGEIKPAPSS